MKVRFLGAARGVTGSCYMMEVQGKRFAVDCGLHQGNSEIEKRNWNIDLYDPASISFIMITHAHIDHCGLLPRLVQKGFKGKVYATPPTVDLLEIMLTDSAFIQEMEAEWKSKKLSRHGKPGVMPLYKSGDVFKAMKLVHPVEYNEEFSPCNGVHVLYKDAGHILGSSIIEIRIQEENDKRVKLVFSGDLGRPNQLLVRNPSYSEVADFLFMESTYGNRDHKNEDQSRDELLEAVNYSYNEGQKVIIPAFALERTQEVLYSFYLLHKEGRLPEDMPIFLDSPLAIRATQIFSKHYSYFDSKTRGFFKAGEDPLKLPNLKLMETASQSMSINTYKGPAIIISASGMANAGRVKHHLRHNIWKKGASIVFVGFQAKGTPGRKIVDGAKTIKILGEELAVKARVFTINGFSAHAGQSHILDWLSHFQNHGMKVFLMHGEYESQKVLSELIREKFDHEVHIPEYLEECLLKPNRVYESRMEPGLESPRINWDYVLEELQGKVSRLADNKNIVSSKSWTEQVEMRDDALEAGTILSKIISSLHLADSDSNSTDN
ncbi:MBL fold metallo-hydrolase RNA specificity domain-containing protein [Desulfonatronovibrio magnus]|uniref:MBL fold metallo-hydrolase RNA specificity domain-containing protein n=1 Tax=Desulfonatronovibrio magnus TaxID=698827 RepID=UPI0005EB7F3A|nr:MBL fold metallo-hydrolase [Desulfonatronovibrio magnus]RQD59744.1 MAG: MBL fold metallo-hydrolase [Desulfonatronovibrio sp. MSAO_Bac4]